LFVQIGESAGETNKAFLEFVVLIKGEFGAKLSVANIELAELPGFDSLSSDDAKATLGVCELFTDSNEIDLSAIEFS
jgi:hypothetical protein